MVRLVVIRSIFDVRGLRPLMRGQAVVMDQEAYEVLAHSLPGRAKFVIPDRRPFDAPDCFVVDDLSGAIRHALISEGYEQLFIIGHPALLDLAVRLGAVDAHAVSA